MPIDDRLRDKTIALTPVGNVAPRLTDGLISNTPDPIQPVGAGPGRPDFVSAVFAQQGVTQGSGSGTGPTLGTLSVSPNTATVGTPYTGTISGATAGSTIVLDSLTVTGTGATRTVTGTPSAAGTWSVTETLSGATNSPNTTNSVLTVASAAAGPALFLIMWGQSNAQALGTATTANGGPNASQVMPAGYSSPNPKVKIWGTSNAFETYQPYVNSEQGSNAGTTWGSEWAIASKWLTDNPTGTAYIVKHAVGSTGLAVGSSGQVWAPSAGQLYTALTNKITAAKAALSSAGVTVNTANTVVVQSQGEQDSVVQTNADAYQTNLTNFISTARTDWVASRWIIERVHLEMTSTGRPGWLTIYAAQGAVIAADQNVEMVSTDALPLIDDVHFSAASCQVKAARTADVVTKFWLKAPYTGQTNIFDVTNDRYIRATTAGDVTTMKSGLPDAMLTVSAASSAQRLYIDSAGVRRGMPGTNTLRFSFGDDGVKRLIHEAVASNAYLWSRDLTNAVNTATNITAVKDQTGRDGQANSCSRITSTAAAGTILQTITAASANRVSSVDVKRLVGTGTLEMTQDGGTTWTVLTVTAGWTRVAIPAQTALTNPSVGFRIATSGDSFAIDAVQNEIGLFATSPIYTTTAAVTRQLEKISLAGTDWNGTAGTFVYRGRAAVSVAGQMIGGDGTKGLLQRQTSATQAQTNNDADLKLIATAGSGSFAGTFGVAMSFDATGRKVCFNAGTIASDANPVASRTAAPTVGAASNTNATTATGGQADLVSWGPALTSDANLPALAVANS